MTLFCMASILSDLKAMKIPLSDVKELELEIGLNEVILNMLIMISYVCMSVCLFVCLRFDFDFVAGFKHIEGVSYIGSCSNQWPQHQRHVEEAT